MEQRRIRRFVQGLNVEIQEVLEAAQLTTFREALEKGQRVELARSQVKAFHAQKRGPPSTNLGQGDRSAPPPKARRGAGGTRVSEAPRNPYLGKSKLGKDNQESPHQKGKCRLLM